MILSESIASNSSDIEFHLETAIKSNDGQVFVLDGETIDEYRKLFVGKLTMAVLIDETQGNVVFVLAEVVVRGDKVIGIFRRR